MSHVISHSSSRSLVGVCHTGGHYPKASRHISSHHHDLHKDYLKNSSISHLGSHYQDCNRRPTTLSFSSRSCGGHGYGVGIVFGAHSPGRLLKSSGGHDDWKTNSLVNINEKETMQHLNQRLSSYIEKVHALEQDNAQLERRICEWYSTNAPSTLPDSSQFFRSIQDLQNEIFSTKVDNTHIIMQIDNAQLAADDLRNKYAMELDLRRNIEADVSSLRKALEQLNMQSQDLEIQVRCLQEELLQLKSNHEEDVNSLRAQLGARVNVEVDAAPSTDLNKILSEVRDQYENLMERNIKEVESIFLARSAELNREVSSGADQLQSVSSELTDLKRSVQTLEIDLLSQLSMKSALENTLAETKATFGSQLAQLQEMIDNIESQLGQIRSDLERQNYEYKILMDQKTHLEMEITTYKQLLDGNDIRVPAQHSTEHKDGIFKLLFVAYFRQICQC
ncbi:keratin, type I cytoskeletal 19-like [Phyllobates terribilis]|uniref:keratin, type I cytoskeletal 19-like n=1 Tax=Phyllobates terribilis TaxID=111132 RepID=UPI003CCB63FA